MRSDGNYMVEIKQFIADQIASNTPSKVIAIFGSVNHKFTHTVCFGVIIWLLLTNMIIYIQS